MVGHCHIVPCYVHVLPVIHSRPLHFKTTCCGNFPLGLVHRKRPPQVSRIHCIFPTFYPHFYDLWGPFSGCQPKWKISNLLLIIIVLYNIKVWYDEIGGVWNIKLGHAHPLSPTSSWHQGCTWLCHPLAWNTDTTCKSKVQSYLLAILGWTIYENLKSRSLNSKCWSGLQYPSLEGGLGSPACDTDSSPTWESSGSVGARTPRVSGTGNGNEDWPGSWGGLGPGAAGGGIGDGCMVRTIDSFGVVIAGSPGTVSAWDCDCEGGTWESTGGSTTEAWVSPISTRVVGRVSWDSAKRSGNTSWSGCGTVGGLPAQKAPERWAMWGPP